MSTVDRAGESRTVLRGVSLWSHSNCKGGTRPFLSVLCLHGQQAKSLRSCCNQIDPYVVKDFNYCMFPLLGDVSRSPHIDKEVVEVADEFGVVKFQRNYYVSDIIVLDYCSERRRTIRCKALAPVALFK